VSYSEGSDFFTEFYSYDNLGRLTKTERTDDRYQYYERHTIETREYDGAGRVVHEGPGVNTLERGYVLALDDVVNFRNRTNRYDAHGRLAGQHVQDSDGYVPYDIVYDRYDNVGNLVAYRLLGYGDHNYTNTYEYGTAKFEGYKESKILGRSDTFDPGSTTYDYDQNGNLTGITDSTKPANDRVFVNDGNGTVLQTTQGGKVLRNLIVNGEVLGQYGVGIDADKPRDDDGNPVFKQITALDPNFRAIDSNFPAASIGSYQVQAGDTLQGIARSAYGDSSLWWKVAQANGITGNSDLRVGQTLTLPSSAGLGHNNVGTFRPFDPSTIVGDTTPNLPSPQGSDCGGLGLLLVVIIAIAVTAITDGAAAPEAEAAVDSYAASEATLAAENVAEGVDALDTFATTFTQVSGQLSPLVEFGVPAAAAAAGSIASQAFAVATGISKKFDWNQVGLAAIGGGVGGELRGWNLFDAGEKVANAAVRQALGNAITQKVAVVTHLKDHFKWIDVAAAAAGGAVSELVGEALNAQGEGTVNQNRQQGWAGIQQVGKATLQGFAAGLTTAVMRGGRVNVQQVATDAFGNALGDSLAAGSGNSDGEAFLTGPDQSDAETARLSRLAAGNGSPYTGGQDFQNDLFERTYANRRNEPELLSSWRDSQLMAAIDPSLVNSLQPPGGYRVDISGPGWTDDFQLPDGTYVYKSNMDKDDPRRLITNMPLDVDPPDVPGYAWSSTTQYLRSGHQEFYYLPMQQMSSETQAVRDEFRRTEIEQMNAGSGSGGGGFDEVNSQKVTAGTYDRFHEMGQAWSQGRYGDIWRHAAFDPADAAKAANNARLNPPPSPEAQRLDKMLGSPVGAGLAGITAMLGGSQRAQDIVLDIGSFSEGIAGASVGMPRGVRPTPRVLARKVTRTGGDRGPRLIPDVALETARVNQGDAARAKIVNEIARAAQPSIEAIRKLDPNARIGFRGSLARGLKGDHKIDANGKRVAFDGDVAYVKNRTTGRYEPYSGRQGYDADFFIVSDNLAGQLSGDRGTFKDAARLDRSLPPVFKKFGGAMQSNSELSGMKPGTPSFRVWSEEDMARKVQSGDPQYYFFP